MDIDTEKGVVALYINLHNPCPQYLSEAPPWLGPQGRNFLNFTESETLWNGTFQAINRKINKFHLNRTGLFYGNLQAIIIGKLINLI